MILHIQSDASYLSRPNSRSVAGGIFYLGNHDQPTLINGAIHAISSIIPVVVASVGEAEYAALFMNGQEGEGLRAILTDLGHPQPATIILCDNQCAVGIATDTVKVKKTKSIDMKFNWIRDRVRQKHFIISWRKGEHNLADFFTKALPVHIHQSLMPLLVFSPVSSPAFHTYAATRSLRWKCIGKKCNIPTQS
jgi:3',5'-cyclic AMP phosphodiesterase CpdA